VRPLRPWPGPVARLCNFSCMVSLVVMRSSPCRHHTTLALLNFSFEVSDELWRLQACLHQSPSSAAVVPGQTLSFLTLIHSRVAPSAAVRAISPIGFRSPGSGWSFAIALLWAACPDSRCRHGGSTIIAPPIWRPALDPELAMVVGAAALLFSDGADPCGQDIARLKPRGSAPGSRHEP